MFKQKKTDFRPMLGADASTTLQGIIVEYTIPQNYDTVIGSDIEIKHRLGRPAQGILPLDGSPIMRGQAEWNDKKIFVKSLVANRKIKLLVY